jgi:tRNA (mo5U34)-methyltransferase
MSSAAPATHPGEAAAANGHAGDAASVRREIESMAPWFHNLVLPHGDQTAPDHPLGPDFPVRKWREIEPFVPQDLSGWSVLDIGCNAGFYSIELAKRGATVVGIDSDPHFLRQARWAAAQFGVGDRIEFREQQVYDLARTDEQFDLVWFMGVFYHLRYPLLGLDIVAARVRRLLVFQTLTMPGDDVYDGPAGSEDIEDRDALLQPGWPKLAFLEHSFFNDPTNWWAPNHAAVEAMLRSSGLATVGRPGHEIYVCEPISDPGRVMPWSTPEFRAATGTATPDAAQPDLRKGVR